MHPEKRLFVLINIFGGIAVLGSYVLGFLARADAGTILWGGVPQSLRPFYTINMFLAAAGYFAFSIFILSLNPEKTKVFRRSGFGMFNTLFAAILISSALWMPLTLLAVEQATPLWSWLVTIDLALVALASLGLLFALLTVQPRQSAWLHRFAVLGSIFFCIQTVILDAIVWVSYFQI
jgi:hypothetical protein